MSLNFQGFTSQRLFKTALIASAIHAACGYAASDDALLALSTAKSTSREPLMTVTAPETEKKQAAVPRLPQPNCNSAAPTISDQLCVMNR